MREGGSAPWWWPTCVAPHGQVLVLLDVQHDLQAVARPPLHGGAQRLALLGCVEHVALAVPGEHLRRRRRERGGALVTVSLHLEHCLTQHERFIRFKKTPFCSQ